MFYYFFSIDEAPRCYLLFLYYCKVEYRKRRSKKKSPRANIETVINITKTPSFPLGSGKGFVTVFERRLKEENKRKKKAAHEANKKLFQTKRKKRDFKRAPDNKESLSFSFAFTKKNGSKESNKE
jgi:hypothetical protein